MIDRSLAESAVAEARVFCSARACPDWNTVACVVLTDAGRRFLAMNLDSRLPRASVCAEPIALGMALAKDPDDPVVFSAAVTRYGAVIAPCGPCRELMLDYAGGATVAVPRDNGFECVHMCDLMPSPYKPDERRL